MEVTASNYESEVLQSDQPVIVDYYAEWCGPCHAIAPVLEKLAEKHNLKLVKVDVDLELELAEKAGVSGIPNVQLVKDGAVQAVSVGAKPLSKLEGDLGL